MTPEEVDPLLRRVMRDARKLYVDSGRWLVSRHKTLLGSKAGQFVELMDDLHRGLLIKVYTEVIRGDGRWSPMEKHVGTVLIEHLWDERLTGSALREAAQTILRQADTLSWTTLVKPFVEYQPLKDHVGNVETVVMRLANLVAKCDGLTTPEESLVLHRIHHDLTLALGGKPRPLHRPVAPDEELPVSADGRSNQGTQSGSEQGAGSRSTPFGTAQQLDTLSLQDVVQQTPVQSNERASTAGHNGKHAPRPIQPEPQKTPEERLKEALGELERLTGLEAIKERVQSLTNFLKLRRERELAGLPTMPISLHMAFVGNPGTGKTTVARIVGQILGAMGILRSGHLVETDRSGLVAEFAGQTPAKTNKLVDSALDGVLFIDEAYSLVSARGEDQFGHEAIQTLLKRMEDARDRLVVIMAGYPEEMDEMIRSNPGLTSRINTRMHFDDYAPADLGKIFEGICITNHFKLPPISRHRLLVGFDELYRERDRHFGNGRLARNSFEECVRRLADRVADIAPVTPDLLSKIEPEDISIPGLSSAQVDELVRSSHTLRAPCTHCQKRLRLEGRMLGCRLRCPACETEFVAQWAAVERA